MNARVKIFSAAVGIIWLIGAGIFFTGLREGFGMGKEPGVILGKQDNGKGVKLKAGQVFQIQLEAIGGTGYWWYVQPPDAAHVELLGEKTRDRAEGRVGGPVLGTWTFQAKGAGATEIKMDSYRAWEGIGKAVEKFRVKITIE